MDLPGALEHPAGDHASLFVLRPEHVGPPYLSWMRDPMVQRFLESRHATHTEASLCSFVEAALADPDTLMMGIRDRQTGAHVGNIKIGPVNRHHGTADIGLMIGDRSAWGRGFGSAAISAICEIAQTSMGVRKATANASSENPGSVHAFLKAGFGIEGRRVAQLQTEEGLEDQIIMGKVLAP